MNNDLIAIGIIGGMLVAFASFQNWRLANKIGFILVLYEGALRSGWFRVVLISFTSSKILYFLEPTCVLFILIIKEIAFPLEIVTNINSFDLRIHIVLHIINPNSGSIMGIVTGSQRLSVLHPVGIDFTLRL